MKRQFSIPVRATIFCLLFGSSLLLSGAEKEGLRVEVVPKVIADKTPVNSHSLLTEVDQEMSLKATFKNISMKDAPESSIDYVVIVQRWTGTEKEDFKSYKGTQPLEALKFGHQAELDIGKYHLGGHLHGTSDRHKDRLAAWQIMVTQGGKKIEFNTPNFANLNQKATTAAAGSGRR